MPFLEESYDIAVVGAGHAGCEAALAAARLGFETIMFTVSVDSIALMPCNPNIGGSSKGHLVRELLCCPTRLMQINVKAVHYVQEIVRMVQFPVSSKSLMLSISLSV